MAAVTTEAVLATSRSRLSEVMAQWPDRDGEETSWALVFVSVVPTGSELSAVREAARLCDRVVVARLTPDRVAPPNIARLVREAGGDILFMPQSVDGRVQVKVLDGAADAVTTTLMLQSLTTVLPMAVVVSRQAVDVARILRAFQHGFGGFFDLRFID